MHFSTTRIVILFSDLYQLFSDDSSNSRRSLEDIAEIRNKGELLYELILYLFSFESCESLELHLEDRSGLLLRK